MANKNDNYYFINGNNIESSAIYVPYNGTYVKNVRDISDFDEATIELGTNLRDALEDCNPLTKFNVHNYIGKYPYAKGIKIFKPIEIYKETPDINEVVDLFRELVDERQFNYYHDKSLDDNDKQRIERFINLVLKKLNTNQRNIVFSKDSIIGKNIKSNRSDNLHIFMEQLSNYTQLRNLLINYISIKSGRYIPTTYKLKSMANSLENIERLYPESPENIAKALQEYKESILNIKNEEEKKKIEETFIANTQEEYKQITLFDVFHDETLKSLNLTNKN